MIVIIICYHYAKQKVIIKNENNELKKVCIKNRACYYFDDVNKLKGFNLDHILIDEKSHKNILIYDISCKTSIGLKLRWNYKDF